MKAIKWCGGINNAGNAARSAGVAVLVRRALVNSGRLVLRQQHVVATPQGRLVVLPLQWGGHDLRVVSCYLPNSSTDQQAFINDCMRVHLPGEGAILILLRRWLWMRCPLRSMPAPPSQ